MSDIIGWDVGGAHLKAASVEAGRIVDVVQLPCTLWLGLEHLEAALRCMRGRIGEAPRHAVTTTGELTDLFASRQDGVAQLIDAMVEALRPAQVAVYAGRCGFVAPDEAASLAADIASANWHASTALVARKLTDALFVDMGSTTTDIIPLAGGQVMADGYSDAERLVAGELVYTGLTRSFLMAECRSVPFRGRFVPLMNEYFANMADVYRVLGLLDEAHDQHATADGRDKSAANSHARIARMLGMDAADASDIEWQMVAGWFMQSQMRRIEDAVRLVGSRQPASVASPVVAAGVGATIVAQIAQRLDRPSISFDKVIGIDTKQACWASACAPAAAVALLLG